MYTNFIVDEFTSEVTEKNRTDLNLEKIASLDHFSVLTLVVYWYTGVLVNTLYLRGLTGFVVIDILYL